MQRCLVTGANRGLGLEFTRQLLARGARVLACCRDPERADALNALREQHPDNLVVHALDVADAAAIKALPDAVARHLQRLDLLVNNAGVLVSGERFGNVEAESLMHSFAVNAAAPLLLAQTLAPLLARGHKPKVLCVSTQLASIAQASGFRTLSYAMSKAALNMAVKRLASELGHRGIVVMALHPGWAQTDMGGGGATVPAHTSVEAMLGIVERADPEDGGKFLAYDGAPLPW